MQLLVVILASLSAAAVGLQRQSAAVPLERQAAVTNPHRQTQTRRQWQPPVDFNSQRQAQTAAEERRQIAAEERRQAAVAEDTYYHGVRLGELPGPWVLGDLPRPLPPRFMEEEDQPVVREQPRFLSLHPHRNFPFQSLRPRPESGNGVALHPGGATSYVFPQMHGVGKRAVKPSDISKPLTSLPRYPNFPYHYQYHHPGRYYHPYYNYHRHPYHHYPNLPSPATTHSQSRNYVYHHQLHKRSPHSDALPGAYHGYSYSW